MTRTPLFSYSGPHKSTHYYTLIAILFGYFLILMGVLVIAVGGWKMMHPPYPEGSDIQFAELTSEHTKTYAEEVTNMVMARTSKAEFLENKPHYQQLLNRQHGHHYGMMALKGVGFFLLGLLLWVTHRGIRQKNL